MAAILNISSCSDDDEPEGDFGSAGMPNVSSVFTSGMPSKINGLSVSLDSQGRVAALTDQYKTVSFSYGVMSRTAETFDASMVVDYGDDECKFYFRLNSSGFVTNAVEEVEEDVYYWWFDYNEAGQLNYMKRSEGGNEVTNITYDNGDAVSVDMVCEEDGENYHHQISYISDAVFSPIPNKGCIMLYDETLGVDMDEMYYAYYAGMLGKSTKHLPVVCSDSDSRTVLNWSLDNDGMPIRLDATFYYDSGYSYTEEPILFVWPN